MSEMKPKATRAAFGEMLAELGASNPKIVALDADLSKSTKTDMFAKKFPERFFDMGIAESNLIGTGAGMALSGYVPFICSFGAFVSGRYDQIRMSVAYADSNVKIVGTHAGIGIGDDGHSQMGLEDLSLMRGLPGMMVFQPCDELETRAMVKFASEHQGPAYFRLTRQNLKPVHDANYKWEFGKLDVLKKGKSGVVFIGTGAATQECVEAGSKLDATVVNCHTIKPFDEKGLLELVKGAKLIVTVEDHYTTGGLGSCVAETLADAGQTGAKLMRLGVRDQFGESGEPAELYDKFGFSAAKIVEAVSAYISVARATL